MSTKGVLVDFRFTVGPYEFSCGRCDRETVQDVLQFLCGVWQDGVQGTDVAFGSGGRASYELRRVDDGAADSGERWGLLVCRGTGTSTLAKEGASDGVSGGLGGRSDECGDRRAGGSAGHVGVGDDVADHGKESITHGSPVGVGQSQSGRVGGVSGGRAPGLALGEVERGPNYARNRLNRMRRKEKREASLVQAGSFFSSCSEGVQIELRDTRAELLVLQNKRRIVEEQRRLDQLKSPMQFVDDVMKRVEAAERYAKCDSTSKVAAWAVAASKASAESMSNRSVGSIPSLKSVTSAGSLALRRERLQFGVVPMADVEVRAVEMGLFKESEVLEARIRCGRALKLGDFLAKDFPKKLTTSQLYRLEHGVSRGYEGYEPVY